MTTKEEAVSEMNYKLKLLRGLFLLLSLFFLVGCSLVPDKQAWEPAPVAAGKTDQSPDSQTVQVPDREADSESAQGLDQASDSQTVQAPDREADSESTQGLNQAPDSESVQGLVREEGLLEDLDMEAVAGKAGSLIGDPEDYPFEVRMLDVGQGLAVLVRAGQDYMIYDGGGRERSSYVVSYLKKHDISSLDYLIASHYDEDHIAGLVGVLNTTTVETALTPDYVADSQIYQSFRTMLEKNGAREIHPRQGDSYRLGEAELEILGPESYDYENENSRSLVVKISYGQVSCIISGDAEYEAESDMVAHEKSKLDTDLYVAGHHGSGSSSSPAFVKAMSPDYVLISVGIDNSYGHPAEETLKTLEDNNCQIYRTDQEGEITARSDGEGFFIQTEGISTGARSGSKSNGNVSGDKSPAKSSGEGSGDESDRKNSGEASGDESDGKSSGEASGDESDSKAGQASGDQDGQTSYVLNIRSKIFHKPDCPSVFRMSNHNKKEFTGDREELIDQGYKPCGNCKP